MTDMIEASHRARTMVIADDDPAVVRLLAERCTQMGFDVQTAANGVQLLVKVRHYQPDILIVDVNMPELDGLAVCERLQELAGKPVEVIVVTGSSNPKTIERCESLGIYYVRKGADFWNALKSALTQAYPDMAERVEELTSPSLATEVRQRPRVLVVDDDPDIEAFFSGRLGRCGVDTLYASGAGPGYRLACLQEPNAIVSDYFMPDGNALYLLCKLRITPATANIPFFVMTGKQLDRQDERSLKRDICGRPGAAQIFKKSADIPALFGALQKFCGVEKNVVFE